MLPGLGDFLFLADSRDDAAYALWTRIDALLDRIGLIRNPKKGQWESTQVGEHFGLEEAHIIDRAVDASVEHQGAGGRREQERRAQHVLTWCMPAPERAVVSCRLPPSRRGF
eukprot:jgi/Tetstr1/424504/TSEL_015032.t1